MLRLMLMLYADGDADAALDDDVTIARHNVDTALEVAMTANGNATAVDEVATVFYKNADATVDDVATGRDECRCKVDEDADRATMKTLICP
jgi:hypothetical protein